MAEQPTGGLLNKEAAPEPPPDLVPVRALPCAGRTAPSGTPETNAPGRGHGGQAGSPSLCVRGGRRGASRALQGLPRKDGGPQHPSRLSVPGVRTPRVRAGT